jgi:hypothetical protein
MLRSMNVCMGLMLVLAAGLLQAASAQAAPPPSPQLLEWRVCVTDTVAPPYLHNNPRRLGVAERLLIDAGEAAGLRVELLRLPVRRCRQMLERGQIEAGLAAPTPANLAIAQFPTVAGQIDRARRLVHMRQMWVKPADSAWSWDGQRQQGAAAPETLTVGTVASMQVLIETLRGQGYKVDDAAFNSRQLLGKLQAGRVDLVVGIEEDLRHVLRDPALQDLTLVPLPFLAVDYYAALARNQPPAQRALGERWWTEIARLRELPPYRPD